MKKLTNNFFAILLCSGALFMSSCSSTADKGALKVPPLLETKTNLAPANETQNIKSAYDKAVAALKVNPDDDKQYIALASVFIAEGRITGNGSYYSNAAVKMLDRVITDSSANEDILFQSYSLKSAVLLNMHQFKDALDIAQKGVAISAYNAGIWGALVDANVELGNYAEAVKDCDKMLSIRPDLRSYSRASYLRQIYGDNRGAIDAMKMAVGAGVPGEESTEWARVQLGDLYMNIGKIDSASLTYRTSLVYRPNYVFAQMGLAKVSKANKNYDEALERTKGAINTISEAAFVSFLGDMYALKGDTKKAAEVRNDVVNLLEDGEKNQPSDAPIKHNVSREMAMAYMSDNKMDKALEYAQKDLSMRPDNIDANELIAWIYYLKGDYQNAKIHADKMLHMNTKNANTMYKASLIYAKAGDMAKSASYAQEAKAINPYMDPLITNESNNAKVIALVK